MSQHTFMLNGERVTVEAPDDLRLLWVIRDLIGLTGPKYGCGLDVCKACTCHFNGKACNPCSVRVADIKATDEITTIEGLADRSTGALHPMQQAWLDHDVAQCGFCLLGLFLVVVVKVRPARAAGRDLTADDLDEIRN